MKIAISFLSSLLLLVAACGDDTTGGDNVNAADGGASEADASGANLECAPTPSRLIVLGDSITACAGVAGKMGPSCGPKLFHDSLASSYAPGIVYDLSLIHISEPTRLC